MIESKRAFTTTEVAKIYSISRTSQWKARRAGRLRYRRVGRSVLMTLGDIEEFLESCRESVAPAITREGVINRAADDYIPS